MNCEDLNLMEVAIYKNLACKMSDDFAHIVLCPFWRTFYQQMHFAFFSRNKLTCPQAKKNPELMIQEMAMVILVIY